MGTSPGPSTARLFSSRFAARKHAARNLRAPRVLWKSGIAAHCSRITSIKAGWKGYDARTRVGGDSGASHFLGSYADVLRNWLRLIAAAGLSQREFIEAQCLFAERVGFF